MELLDEIFCQSCKDQNFYEILGCSEFSNMEQIITEYRLKAKQYHPDKNLNNPNATEEFVMLQVAKDVLCDPKLREQYDTWLHSGLQISFKRWVSMKDSLKMSMHWATPVNKTPMIESKEPAEVNESTVIHTSSDEFSETLRKFRNYEI